MRLERIGLNLFPVQLGNSALLADIDDALREFGLPPQMLELEITENVALDFKETELLQRLRDKGINLAFDDFGTGYASLSYLLKFPLSRIKIDRSFIMKTAESANDAANRALAHRDGAQPRPGSDCRGCRDGRTSRVPAR